ncbi:MAG: hypothetical protein KJZ47_05955 [Gemmatimonadales bacterium]|nr:hypothetical protein [Gemmatimonadales bacterium]
MTQVERRRALADSLQEVLDHPHRRSTDIREERDAARIQAGQRRRRLMLVALVAAWGALGWIWLARPGWVFEPPLTTAQGAQYSPEEGLRIGMALQAFRLREFAAETGRLPSSLAEAGEVEEGLSYLVRDGGWILRGDLGSRQLELTSEMSVDSFRQGGGPP